MDQFLEADIKKSVIDSATSCGGKYDTTWYDEKMFSSKNSNPGNHLLGCVNYHRRLLRT